MNIADLHQVHYSVPAATLSAQMVDACDALPTAANTANRLVQDKDRAALEMLDRIAERAEGLRRLALRTREIYARELGGSDA